MCQWDWEDPWNIPSTTQLFPHSSSSHLYDKPSRPRIVFPSWDVRPFSPSVWVTVFFHALTKHLPWLSLCPIDLWSCVSLCLLLLSTTSYNYKVEEWQLEMWVAVSSTISHLNFSPYPISSCSNPFQSMFLLSVSAMDQDLYTQCTRSVCLLLWVADSWEDGLMSLLQSEPNCALWVKARPPGALSMALIPGRGPGSPPSQGHAS